MSRESRKVWEEYWREKVPGHLCIHHIDKNRENNDVTNLTAIGYGKHSRRHREEEKQKINYLISEEIIAWEMRE